MCIVQYFLKQFIVSVHQQLTEVWQVRWAEAASLAAAEKCVYALAVRRRENHVKHLRLASVVAM